MAISDSAPAISVVMPVRNGGGYLRLAVDSILNQSLGDFEFIIIDDGSTDATSATLAHMAKSDERLRLLSSGGQGIVAALNLGIRTARGGLIARMDADDIAEPERLARQRALMDGDPDLLALGTAAVVVDADGRQSGQRDVAFGPGLGRDRYLQGNPFIHPSMMMRRQAVLDAGLYRTGATLAEDYDLWLRLCVAGRLENLPEPLLRFRQHGGQTSITKRLAQRAATAVVRQAFLRRAAGMAEGADFERPMRDAVAGYIRTRAAEDATIRPEEAGDLLVMTRYAQQFLGGDETGALSRRLRRETSLRKVWLMPLWFLTDRRQA